MKKSGIEINLLNVMLLLYLFRSSIPLFKYPFILIFVCYSFYIILIYKKNIIRSLKEYLKTNFLALILVLFIFLAIFLSNKLYLTVFKEVIEIIILLSLFLILTVVVSSKSKLDYFVFNLLSLIPFFAIFIAIINTHVFAELQNYFGYYKIYNYHNSAVFNSLLLDTNFALLPVFFGFFIFMYKMRENVTKPEILIYNLSLLLFSLNIILSSSRRGLFILTLIYIILFLFFIVRYTLGTKYLKLKILISNLRIFYFSVIIIPLIVIVFIQSGSYSFKVKTLKFFGAKDTTTAKRIITSTIWNNLLRLNYVLSYPELNKKLWSIGFDPKDPDNGWGIGYYKTLYPVEGKNKEIVPEGSIGYLLDNSCTFTTSPTHAYSNTFIGNVKVDEHKIVNASVFCYVSDDFNGDLVCLRADGVAFGERVAQYDLNSKGKWQFLSISANCMNGDIPIALYFNKQAVTNFKTLTGYIIFAYPQYEISTRKKLQDSISGRNEGSSSRFVTREVFMYQSSLSLNISESVPSPEYLSYTDTLNHDSDIFRNWIKKIYKEDTSYIEPKIKLKVDTISKFFVDDRLSRWQFALQIFTKEYSLKEKTIGGGFKFLNWYGFFFLNDKSKIDYPHNPFLYILLYSGLLGLLLYLIFIYKIFYYYISFIKEYPLLFVFFLVTSYFTFFSGGNPFDPPIMGFFVLLPFFIHSVSKKGIIEPEKKQNSDQAG